MILRRLAGIYLACVGITSLTCWLFVEHKDMTNELWVLLILALSIGLFGFYLLYGPGYSRSDLKFPWED